MCVCMLDAICQFYLFRRESRESQELSMAYNDISDRPGQARLSNDQAMYVLSVLYRQIKKCRRRQDRLVAGKDGGM